MKKYKVEFVRKETFIVDVLAENEAKAKELAEEKWNAGDYQDIGEIEVETGTIYDVTNTDDPFDMSGWSDADHEAFNNANNK